MAFFDFLTKSKPERQYNMALAKFMNDYPVFSQFGNDIYASDVVQNCIDVIATECSKLMPKHIRKDDEGIITEPKGSINRLFKVAPNPLMTTRDFIEKITWTLLLNYNVFIYPKYEIYKDTLGQSRKRYTGIYPLAPKTIQFEEDQQGKLFVHMYFNSGYDFALPYDMFTHVRKKFSINDIMGGGVDGQPDNEALLKVLETNNIVLEGMGQAVKLSLGARALVKYNTMLDDGSMKKEIDKFNALIDAGDSAVLPMDLKSEFKEIKIDPQVIDKDTLEFLDRKITRWYGPSAAILDGDFNDEQYQAFYEKVLEPILISYSQAFTKAMFSQREIDIGNKIVFYQKSMQYLSTKSKLEILKTSGEQGLLTNDQKLELLGYPPIGGEEGAKRTQSLNFVDTTLVNDYQMAKSSAPQINATGGE